MSESLDQQRASFAWERIGGECSKEYSILAKSAPALVMSNGLMQTLAFFEAKGKDHHEKLSTDLRAWLAKRFGGRQTGDAAYPLLEGGRVPSFGDTMEALRSCESSFYLEATQEALEFLKWLRQIADAVKQGA